MGDVDTTLVDTLAELGITLSKKEQQMNVRPLLKTVLTRLFGQSTGFADMLRDHVPSPAANAENKVSHIYTGDLSSSVAKDMLACNPDGELVVHVTKLFPSQDGTVFEAFGRVMSGTIEHHKSIKVLGEGYTLDDDEDSRVEKVQSLYIAEARCE